MENRNLYNLHISRQITQNAEAMDEDGNEDQSEDEEGEDEAAGPSTSAKRMKIG